MSAALGSMEHAAKLAAGEAMRRGYTRLESLAAGQIASRGTACFQTYSRMASDQRMRRPDGKSYHPESVARAVRRLSRDGLVLRERVMPNHRITFQGKPVAEAKWRTSHGCCVKAFNWRAVEQKNPFSRRAQRQLRVDQARRARDVGDLSKPAAPRHSSAPAARAAIEPHPYTPPLSELDPELARLAERAQEFAARNEARRQRDAGTNSGPVPGHVLAPERPPPD